MASSQRLRSSFNDLRAAGLKGVTFEQAARDIKLSGDIRQIGEGAARIAINDGLYMAEGVSRTKTKPAVDGKKKSADKSRTANTKVRPKKGAVTVSEDVKVTKSMKGDIEVLNRIAEVGDVAVVIEKFEGADKDAKGFYSKGVIHLNADKLSEGGFTYTGIHESVHYLAEANPEGYAAIEKFLKNYYKQHGVDLESQIELTQAIYSKRGVELTPEGAMEEIVCNTLSDIATDKKALSAFLNLSKKEQKSFVDFIRDIAKRLKAWADKNLKGSKYHSVIVKDAKTLRELAEAFNTELSKSAQKNNTADNSGVKYSIGENSKTKDVFGFVIDENAIVDEDLLEEIGTYHPEAEVDKEGNITVYHRTTEDAAKRIKQTGIMKSKEDALFFSSKKNGYVTDYGVSVVKLKIPSTMLRLNDVFDGEVHFDLPLKYKKDGYSLDVSKYLFEDYSLGESNNRMKITENLTDTQRTEILKTKNIVAPVYEGEADFSIENESNLASGRSKLVKSALIRIAEEFNVFTDYDVKDVDLRISLSKSNIKESVQKASEPEQLAKLMPILKETVENAIGIESHKNRYYYDNATVSFDNLLGGYIDGEYFVPVRFGLKHIMGGKTVLYVVVDQQKIKAEVLKTTPQPKVGSTVSRSAYNYNLSQVIPFVNSKDLLRYLPDDILSAEQKKIKQEGIAETIKYTNDKNDAKYAKFIADGNMQAAQDMVDAAAEIAMKDSKIRDKSGNLVKVYHGSDSADFYEFDKARRGQTDTSMYGRGYYFAFDPDYASDFGDNIREFYLDIKNPFYIDINAPSKVIAEFLESKGIEVNISDRYKQSHYFAKMFGSQKFTDTLVDLGFDGVIVRTDEGDYWETVAFHRNQMKLADAVTYDNDGNVIPVSERFSEKRDMRYSFGEEDLDFGLYLNENSEVAENLKESGRAVGAIFEKTKGAEVDIFDVSRVMKKNLRDFGIKGETIDANERIFEVIELATAESYVDGSAVVGEIAAVMKDTLRNSPYVVDNFKEEREDILSRMKGIGKIYLSEDQIAMLEDSDYSLNRFKQKMFGKITVVNKPKTAGNVESLNTLWHSLSEAYPEWFSAETLSDNMPMEMLRVMDELKPQSVGAEEFFMQSNDEIAIELASRVVEGEKCA